MSVTPLKTGCVYIPHHILVNTLHHLRKRGTKGAEGIVYWLSKTIESDGIIVTSCICPKQATTAIGAKVKPVEVAKLIFRIHKKDEFLIAQIHSHPSLAFHSSIDDFYPVIHEVGLLSIVVPNYGFVNPKEFFIHSRLYEYVKHGCWRKLTSGEVKDRFTILSKGFEEKSFDRTKLLITEFGLPCNQALLKFRGCKIALSIDEELLYINRGQYILAAIVNLLSRNHVNLDVFIPCTSVRIVGSIPLINGYTLADGLQELYLKISAYEGLRVNPTRHEKYDVALSIGEGELLVLPNLCMMLFLNIFLATFSTVLWEN